MKDFLIVVLSVLIAIILLKTGLVKNLLFAAQEFKFLGSFVAGLFFTSLFTVAPATVILGQISQTTSLYMVAVLGGLGALAGDWIIFYFVRDKLSEKIFHILDHSGMKRIQAAFRLKFFRWFFALAGAIIIASPLPDEIGLTMMGLSKTKTFLFIPLSFLFNSAGIFIIGLVSRTIS